MFCIKIKVSKNKQTNFIVEAIVGGCCKDKIKSCKNGQINYFTLLALKCGVQFTWEDDGRQP